MQAQWGVLISGVSFELAHEIVGDAAAPRSAWVLHGIFGSRRNWWSFARAFTLAAPEWRFVLVDLRHHGESKGAPPPNTVEACAADLARLAERLGGAPQALIGHSFGGKVALAAAAGFAPALEQLWLMDASPSAKLATSALGAVARTASGAGVVLEALRHMPAVLASRGAAGELLERAGVARPVARWLATSLLRCEGGFTWGFDLPAFQQLLESYWSFDGWPLLEAPAHPHLQVHLVIGAHSQHFSHDDRAHALQLDTRKVLHCQELAGAGHWVQADAPEALQQLMFPHFLLPRA